MIGEINYLGEIGGGVLIWSLDVLSTLKHPPICAYGGQQILPIWAGIGETCTHLYSFQLFTINNQFIVVTIIFSSSQYCNFSSKDYIKMGISFHQ